MREQKEKSIYQKQRKVRPKLEAFIESTLQGERRKNALDFARFLRENRMPPQWASANSWSVSHKNKRVCYVHVAGGAWYVRYAGDFGETEALPRETVEILWEHVHCCTGCGGCGPGIACSIFGRDFNNVCRCFTIQIQDPRGMHLDGAKELARYRKRTILAAL